MIQWADLRAAARRLGRNAGHLRKLCQRLEGSGLARRVKGGGRAAHWEIRCDVGMPALLNASAADDRRRACETPAPVMQFLALLLPGHRVTIGHTSIRVSVPSEVTLTISPAADDGAGKRFRAPSEGAPTDIR